MKDKWSKYAFKSRKIEKSYLGKYRDRSSERETPKTSCGNCIQQSGQEQKEVILRGKDEERREENPLETYQEGRQGIPGTNQGRFEVKERNIEKKGNKMKEKMTAKEKKHESKESKAFEKKEEKKEKKESSKGKKK